MDFTREWISQKEASKYLNLSRTTLFRYRKQGILKSYKIGKQKVIFYKEDILKFIKDINFPKNDSGGNFSPLGEI